MNTNLIHIENNINNLFKDYHGSFPDIMEKLPNSGSDRIYYRLQKGNTSVIASYNNDDKENRAFIDFTNQFVKAKINVPQILAQDLTHGIYITSDLGDQTLLEWLLNEKDFSPKAISIYKKVLSELTKMQIIAGKDFDYTYCYPFKEFDKEAILYDLRYFEEKYLSNIKVTYNKEKLDSEFELFSNTLLKEPNNFFMFRDFQARNIMLVNEKPFFIDYQGGRKGALQYDLVSLLFQAKAQIPEEIKTKLLDYYISEVEKYITINKKSFITSYYNYALIRVLQTLGAYGLRGIIEKKKHFLESIPFAINNLKELYNKVDILNDLSELKTIISEIINKN